MKNQQNEPFKQLKRFLFVTILIFFSAIILGGFLFFIKDFLVLRISSYIAGILILIVWIYYLFVGKTYIRVVGSVTPVPLWQFNILPLLTAICLLLTANIMFIPLGMLFWSIGYLLFFFLGRSMPFILSIIYGWYIGIKCGELTVITFPFSRIVFGIAGIVIIQIVCSLIVTFITGFYDRK